MDRFDDFGSGVAGKGAGQFRDNAGTRRLPADLPRRVGEREWREIENVPSRVREVGAMFSKVAERLVSKKPEQETTLVWSEQRWEILQRLQEETQQEALSGHVPPRPARTPAKAAGRNVVKESAKQRIVRSLDEARAKQDFLQMREFAAPGAAAPQLKNFNERLESFVLATLLWAEARITSASSVSSASSAATASLAASAAPAASLSAASTVPAAEPAEQAWHTAFSLRSLEVFLETAVQPPGGPAKAMEHLRALYHQLPSAEVMLDRTCVGSSGGRLARSCLALPQHSGQQLRLHPEQAQVTSLVLESVLAREPLFIGYAAPPSAGKTSMTALVGSVLSHLSSRSRPRAIYTCYSPVVRVDVCKHLQAAAVPFAIMSAGVATPANSCYFNTESRQKATAKVGPTNDPEQRFQHSLRVMHACDRQPAIIVADLKSALELVRQDPNSMLLLDEPTADFDEELVEDVRRLLCEAPCYTVAMSATLSNFFWLQSAVSLFKQRHAGLGNLVPRVELVLPDRKTTQTAVSVTAVDWGSKVWAPHDFGVDLEIIDADHHLRRFYSVDVLRRLCESLASLGPEERAGLRGLHCRDLMGSEAIRQRCLEVLRWAKGLATVAPSAWHALCRPVVDARGELLWSNAEFGGLPGPPAPPVPPEPPWPASCNFGDLCLGGAARFPGCTLVLTDPTLFHHRSVVPLLEQMSPEHPARVVNSVEHARHFCATLPSGLARVPLQFPEKLREVSNPKLVEGLSVGVVTLGSPLADAVYTAAAQTCAESGQASFVVAPRAFLYGTNLPVDRVLIDVPVLDHAEMRQLCGRVGRTGMAAALAEVVFPSAESLALAFNKELPAGLGVVEAGAAAMLQPECHSAAARAA